MLPIFLVVASICLVQSAPQDRDGSQQSVVRNTAYDTVLEKIGFTRNQLATLVTRTEFKLGRGIREFNKKLLKFVTEEPGKDDQNIILSPFSIHSALSMLYYASPNASNTFVQLADALAMDQENSGDYLFNTLKLLLYYDGVRNKYDTDIKLANKIFIANDFTVKEDYTTMMQAFYLTEAERLDFGSGRVEGIVNDFVSMKTNGFIEELLAPGSIDSLTKMVLINAIYFRANWKYQFDSRETGPMEYNLLGGHEKIFHLKGMRNFVEGARIAKVPELNARVIELPYENTNFNMYVGVPDGDTLDDLNKLTLDFEFEKFADQLTAENVDVEMPSFDIKFRHDNVVGAMRSMGVTDLFTDGVADLSSMTDADATVTDIVHEATVKVKEEGAEAAAATAVLVGIRTVQDKGPSKHFAVNKPFVFMIHDKLHNIPLFVGRIINPSGQGNPGATIAHDFRQAVDEPLPAFAHSEAAIAPPHEAASFAVAAMAPPPAQLQDDDCGEFGYQEVNDSSQISFPCPGRDTPAIEKFHADGDKENKKRKQQLDSAKVSF